jgi:hypothetical protein
MKSNNEPIEEFLKGIVLPEYKSDGHARQLRAQILSGLQARRAGSGTALWWKTAALLLGLLAAGAVAAEIVIRVHHFYLEGKARNGFYYFSTTPGNAGTNQVDSIGVFVRGDLDAAGIEQKRKELEEIDALRQRNARELFRIIDTEVNGKPSGRLFWYKYVLADGRTEIKPELGDMSLSPAQMEGDRQQIAGLRQRGQREILGFFDVEFEGQSQRTLRWRYVLSDGRIVDLPETDPELPGPVPLTREQQLELWQMVLPGKGKFIGSAQVQVHGRTFNFQKYSFTLSDGTVVTRSEGQPEGLKKSKLTAAETEELGQLVAAHKGETLATYEEDVKGKPFKFTRVKYVLSDGTEVIQSIGKPGSGR